MAETREIPLKQWQAEGTKLFGLDPHKWLFVCPVCQQEQSAGDFLELGMGELMACAFAGFSCIGTWRKLNGSKIVVSYGDFTQGDGCSYKGGLVPNMSPVLVVIADSEYRPTFNWHLPV